VGLDDPYPENERKKGSPSIENETTDKSRGGKPKKYGE
jgi:hypothetical protein